ncbi:hypothetical protein HAP47_0032845 [Bradyrhizobium sp. 41S5]|uniref:hypothetical protein n=1 Tax=Bradyrhizobium sp. 41S5 TaxID=1404443 RepID=UPI00156ACDCC|nr:hypothetical protein [Bradyrhizobium sp. 41S5]UFX43952.1 hypothetical protein HAP47_0032845 [Bradyrhizobium sp. 41S5]
MENEAAMIVEIAIPELNSVPERFPSHWPNIILLGNRPDEYKIHAIITTYVRLVEGAYVHYKNAQRLVQAVWNNHDSLAIGSHNLSAIYFEDCINSMHRAVLCMKRIRNNREVPASLRNMFPDTPHFTKDAIANRIRDIRDAIQHMDEYVLKGEIPEGKTFMLTATGPETPVLDPNQPNQTLKRIDRLTIGDAEVLFTDLVVWLHEMGKCAESISKYERPS